MDRDVLLAENLTPAPRCPHDVFISYAHTDSAVADAACAALEKAGIGVWLAPRDVVPGRDWATSIVEAINACRVMLLIFSAEANSSRQVRNEVERAVARGLRIVPLRIADVPPSPPLEYFISASHWLDALSPPVERHLDRLVGAVRVLLSDVAHSPTSATVPAERVRLSPPFRRRRVLAPVVAAAGLSIALGAALWIRRAQPAWEELVQQGRAAVAARRLEDARTAFDRAVMAAPERPEPLVERAAVRLDRGDYSGVVADCNRALSIVPDEVACLGWRGMVEAFGGNADAATRDGSQAIELDRTNAGGFLARSLAFSLKAEAGAALADAEEGQRLAPDDPWARIVKGVVLSDGGRHAEALAELDAAIRLDPNLGPAYAHRAWRLMLTGERARAIADADQAIRLAPLDWYAHLARAYGLSETPRWEESRAAAVEATRLSGGNPLARVVLAIVALKNQEPERALAEARGALAGGDGWPIIHAGAAVVFIEAGARDDAAVHAERAVRGNPLLALGYTARGAVRMASNDEQGAIGDFQTVTRLTPGDAQALMMLGGAYLEAGRLGDAARSLDESLERGRSAEAFIVRARISLRRNDPERARADLEQAIGLEPESDEPLFWLGRAWLEEGKADEAMAALTRAVEIDARDPYNRYWLGRANTKAGRFQVALQEFDAAIASGGDDADLYGERAWSRLMLGDLEGAREDYDAAIAIDPESFDARYWRGRLHYWLGSPESGRDDLDRAIAIFPESALAYEARARIRDRLGDVAGADADRRKAIELTPEPARRGEAAKITVVGVLGGQGAGAGARIGDVIEAYAGSPVSDSEDLTDRVMERLGQHLGPTTLTVRRGATIERLEVAEGPLGLSLRDGPR